MSKASQQDIERRFWAKVHKTHDCWLWSGGKSDTGYGSFNAGTRYMSAHRFSYEVSVGAIPAGLTIDHLCRNRACVNPAHLEAVPIRENVLRARRTHCKWGHPLSGDNLWTRRDKCGFRTRVCRECNRLRKQKYWREKHHAHESSVSIARSSN